MAGKQSRVTKTLEEKEEEEIMPIKKVKGGWRWGKSGKIHKTKKRARTQEKAIYASGYKGRSRKSG